jgi:hypothetical protein
MTSFPFHEAPVMWSRVGDAVRFWGNNSPQELPAEGDETSCVVRMREDLNVKKMRDWLYKEFDGNYEMTGLCEIAMHAPLQGKMFPYAVRFRFRNFDDKLLFALRWL